MRPFPTPSDRPLAEGVVLYVDAIKGRDQNTGSKSKPWKTLQYAVRQLQAGDTLLLREGRYYEHVLLPVSGTTEKPVTIRSHPGELAIVDGGIREFFENPAASWEPAPGGVQGEFRSKKTYPGLHGRRKEGPHLMGRFADSMIPLHGYNRRMDLVDTTGYRGIQPTAGDSLVEPGLYCGPGIWYDPDSARIHVRLAPTNWKFLPEENRYRGETDPRKLPLIIAAHAEQPPFTLRRANHVRVQDLVFAGSGARAATVRVSECQDIELDGVTVYGGGSAVTVDHTHRFRFWNSSCRGVSAPWTFRGHLKYRSAEARLVSASGWLPNGNRDFEFAYSEFTDSVDGVFLGNVAGAEFHHNLLDNISDDGIFLTATTEFDGTTPGGTIRIYQNLLSRCLSTLAFGVGHGRQRTIAGGKQTGAGIWIYRNVFDLRKWVPYRFPVGSETIEPAYGRTVGDHAGPTWEPMFIYQNTVIAYDSPWRDYYAAGLSRSMRNGTKRRVFNNIFAHVTGSPGSTFDQPLSDFQADGNLHWSFADQARPEGWTRPPGWPAQDQFADPKFARFSGDWRQPFDLGLQGDSPAIHAGVAIPSEWPDPLRETDKQKPDLGAIPFGVEPWRLGVRGRLTMFGEDKGPVPTALALSRRNAAPDQPLAMRKPAVIVKGYPAFEAPLVEFALRRRSARVDILENTWLPPKDYEKYGLVVVVADLARAQIEPRTYSEEDLDRVQAFLERGGALLLMRGTLSVFSTAHGQAFLRKLTGAGPQEQNIQPGVWKPDHPWVRHLDPSQSHPWLGVEHATPLGVGESKHVVIGAPAGSAILCELPVGKGRLIYVGWRIAKFIPEGRNPKTTIEDERVFEEQVQILKNIAAELFP